MLVFVTGPIAACIIALTFIWGGDPTGPVMETMYVVAAVVVFFSAVLSE